MFKNIANMDSFLRDEDYSTNVVPEIDCAIEGSVEPEVFSSKKKHGSFVLCGVVLLMLVAGGIGCKCFTQIDTGSSVLSGIFSENVLNEVLPESGAISAAATKREVISVQRNITKADPFMPYREVSSSFNAPPKFELLEPPTTANEGSEAARVMDTSVSGILYDAYSPSAILNIEGIDQLVKEGDVVNNYHVLNIDKTSVTVKLGSNVYRAGIGEILTSGELNHNKVSNLDRKFGGKNGN